jgi:hypothetical protein
MATQDDPYGGTPPLRTTDVEEVIRAQLTENTGRHMLDSGGAYGRHWESNQETPPWDDPEWVVNDSWVTHNVYHFMRNQCDRDDLAVSLEATLYAFGNTEQERHNSWLRTMEGFVEALASDEFTHSRLEDMSVPSQHHMDVLGYQAEMGDDVGPSFNTYNQEYHTLSQCLQGQPIGGLYSEYHMVQVHGGCDIRGGYTVPRVYRTDSGIYPHELGYYEVEGEWREAESCLYRDDSLIYMESVFPEELAEAAAERVDEKASSIPIWETADHLAGQAWDDDHMSGGIFRVTEDTFSRVVVY